MATFLHLLVLRSELVRPEERLRLCRDPGDDIFLEAAVAAGADRVVTNDQDLHALQEVRGVRIVSPAEFAEEIE